MFLVRHSAEDLFAECPLFVCPSSTGFIGILSETVLQVPFGFSEKVSRATVLSVFKCRLHLHFSQLYENFSVSEGEIATSKLPKCVHYLLRTFAVRYRSKELLVVVSELSLHSRSRVRSHLTFENIVRNK